MAHSREAGDTPPIYKIDLSFSPAERYVELAHIYRNKLRSLTHLFDDLVSSVNPNISLGLIRGLAQLCMRRLSTSEETEEIRGISKATDIPMYLLVSFNVLLDLLMGCTSGGVRVKDRREGAETKMLHFRTLDWGMDALRTLVVQLHYVRSPDTDTVLARSITYVGFVGVLTGVRKDLSLSLNFRPTHNVSSRFSNILFYSNHLLVLLGMRRSISSLLRKYIIPESNSRGRKKRQNGYMGDNIGSESRPPSLANIESTLPSTPTTAAYLIFSDGTSTLTMEKDYKSAIIRRSSSFIVATNNDLEPEAPPTEQVAEEKRESHAGLGVISGELQSVAELIEDSNERRDCIQEKWDKKVRREQQKRANNGQASGASRTRNSQNDPVIERRTSARLAAQKNQSRQSPRQSSDFSNRNTDVIETAKEDDEDIATTPKEAIKWVSDWPITNETTHYAVVMDPTEGEVVWVKRYLHPVAP